MLMERVQAASQGAGQIRPVNSGKLLVAWRARDGLLPIAEVCEIVPFWDEVTEWATVVAERDAAVHAACGLLAGVVLVPLEVDFAPIVQALALIAALYGRAFELFESVGASHGELHRSSGEFWSGHSSTVE